jgi:hypothetical protein
LGTQDTWRRQKNTTQKTKKMSNMLQFFLEFKLKIKKIYLHKSTNILNSKKNCSMLLIFLVFCVVFFCLRHVSCVPNVSSFSGLSFLDCPFSLFCFLLANTLSEGMNDSNKMKNRKQLQHSIEKSLKEGKSISRTHEWK